MFDTAILTVALQKTIANFDNIRLRVEDGTSAFGAPTAVTDDATNIGLTTATLNGRTNANGIPSYVHVPLRPDDAMPRRRRRRSGRSPPAPGRRSSHGRVTISGLTACTTYFFRIEATNAEGSDVGSTLSFKTACKPTSRRWPSSSARPSATFHSRVNPNSLDTKVWYEYGTVASGAFGSRIPAVGQEIEIGDGSKRSRRTPIRPTG